MFNTLRLLSPNFTKVILWKSVGLSEEETKQRGVAVRPEIKEFDDIKVISKSKTFVLTQENIFLYIKNIHLNYKLNSKPSKPANPSNSFKVTNCFFGASRLKINEIERNFIHYGHGIPFLRAGSWRFGNDDIRYVVIFGIDNISLRHSEICKNNL